MEFTKLSIKDGGTVSVDRSVTATEIDIWAIFRALRDTRGQFGLRPGHVQTLQAMLSFLKPGHGDTVFASNFEICRRVGGIDERTLRRHIDRFINLGFMKRCDSPNGKRYRIRSSNGQCISYGLSLTPLLERAEELFALAQEMESIRRDQVFLRKQILTRLAILEDLDPENTFLTETRKTLRRKLTVSEYEALLAAANAQCEEMSTAVDTPKAIILPANDGQTARHYSKSEKEGKDLESTTAESNVNLKTLVTVCHQATCFATNKLSSWSDVETHAKTLAPMMGIHPSVYEKAKEAVGSRKASSAIFILLQLGSRIRNYAAYFHSITLGRRELQFKPTVLLERLSRLEQTRMDVHHGGHL